MPIFKFYLVLYVFNSSLCYALEGKEKIEVQILPVIEIRNVKVL